MLRYVLGQSVLFWGSWSLKCYQGSILNKVTNTALLIIGGAMGWFLLKKVVPPIPYIIYLVLLLVLVHVIGSLFLLGGFMTRLGHKRHKPLSVLGRIQFGLEVTLIVIVLVDILLLG